MRSLFFRFCFFCFLFLSPIFLLGFHLFHFPFPPSTLLSAGIFLLPVGCGGGSGSSVDLNLSLQNCGNALINENESCDDGNTNNSDGCNNHCAWEVGEAICGNGVLENEECCDDGNNVDGDGCSATCTSEKNNHPPSAPILADEPQDGATWVPTRLYLSWSPATDLDVGDKIVYDVYFVEGGNGISPSAFPYKKDLQDTHFVIQASTDNRGEYFPDRLQFIYLKPSSQYFWKVCARDSLNYSTCSETRIFNTTASNVASDGVAAWFKFDRSTGDILCPGVIADQNLCDPAGSGNQARINGNPGWTEPVLSSLLGGTLQLDAIDDYISMQNQPLLNPDSITVIARFRMGGKVGEQSILDKRESGKAGYQLRVQGDLYPLDLVWIITGTEGPERIVVIPRVITNGVFYNVVATFDSSRSLSNVYLNGVRIASQSFSVFDRSIKSNVNLLMGDTTLQATPSVFNFRGWVDEIILLRRFLSETEVNNQYQSMLR